MESDGIHDCTGCGNPCNCGSEAEEDCMECERFCQYGYDTECDACVEHDKDCGKHND